MDLLFITMLFVVFIAAILATFATFGFTALFLAPLSLIIPLPQAIAISGIVDLANGLSRGWFFRNKVDWKLVVWYGIPGVVFSLVGSSIIAHVDKLILQKTLGIFLIVYGITKLVRKKVAFPIKLPMLITGGALTGFLAGFIGAGGALRSAFLSNYKLPVAQFIATTTLIEILVDIARAGGYFTTITLTTEQWIFIFCAIPVSFAGVWLASRFAKKISTQQFETILASAILLFGIFFFSGIIKG